MPGEAPKAEKMGPTAVALLTKTAPSEAENSRPWLRTTRSASGTRSPFQTLTDPVAAEGTSPRTASMRPSAAASTSKGKPPSPVSTQQNRASGALPKPAPEMTTGVAGRAPSGSTAVTASRAAVWASARAGRTARAPRTTTVATIRPRTSDTRRVGCGIGVGWRLSMVDLLVQGLKASSGNAAGRTCGPPTAGGRPRGLRRPRPRARGWPPRRIGPGRRGGSAHGR